MFNDRDFVRKLCILIAVISTAIVIGSMPKLVSLMFGG